MDAMQAKLAHKFNLTAAQAAELIAAGLDTPHKIAAAKPTELPASLRDKLAIQHGGLRAMLSPAATVAAGDDLTKIPRVGKETQNTLNNAGLLTYDDLRGASAADLLDLGLSHGTLEKIREFLA